MQNRERQRVCFVTTRDLLKKCDMYLEAAGCRSRNEYINRAIAFYNNYMASGESNEFYPKFIVGNIQSLVDKMEIRLAKEGFRQAIEVSKLVCMIAPLVELDEAYLSKLHKYCTDEVKKLNGTIKPDFYYWG